MDLSVRWSRGQMRALVTPVTDLIPNPKSLIPGFSKSLIPGARGAADALLAALLAPPCAVCDALLDQPTQGCVCSNCWASIRPITPPVCDKCGDPLATQPQSLVGHPRSPVCAQCCERESA